MNKKLTLLIMVFVLLFFLSLTFFIFKKKSGEINAQKSLVIGVGDCQFNVEVADTPKDREKGLSERKKMCDKCGMLFSFLQSGVYGFWMKKMFFPIDLIWLQNNKVIGFKENFSEKSEEIIFPPKKVNYVLEINSGKIKECNIVVGERLIVE